MRKFKLHHAIFYFAAIQLILLSGCGKEVFVEADGTGSGNSAGFIIDSNPQGFKIYIEGKYTGYTTPDTITGLQPGIHTISLKKDLYWDSTFTVNILKDSLVLDYIDFYKSNLMLGNIDCKSVPSGASIYLNDVNTGRTTPATLTKLFPNTYNVRFEYPEYRGDSLSITVSSGKTITASVTLDDTLDIVLFDKENAGLVTDYITGIGEDKNGKIWFGTGSCGLYKYDGKKISRFTEENSSFVKSNFVKSLHSDSEGNLYVGFSNAITRYDGSAWDAIGTKAIMTIQIMENNTMLAATDNGGIIKFSGGNWENITQANSGMPSDNIISACYDSEGKLWCGLRFGGVAVFDGKEWIRQDSAKYLLPASICAGINLTKDGQIVGIFYNPPAYFYSFTIHKIAIFKNGLWNVIRTISSAWIEDKEMYIDDSNRLWYTYESSYSTMGRLSVPGGSSEILYYIVKNQDIRKFSSWASSTIIDYFKGRKVFVDSKNNLWIYGEWGAFKIKNGRWNN